MMTAFFTDHLLLMIYIASGLMLLAVLTFLFMRLKLYSAFVSDTPEEGDGTKVKGITVVICSHDDGEELEKHLPPILSQRGIPFEVVVIDDCSRDSTPDVLKRLSAAYPNLRHTFVPRTARYVSHTKLAISLGVKAARYDWIVLTRPTCAPLTDLWLRTMAAQMTGDAVAVLGYANYADNGSLAARRAVFERLSMSALWFLSARHTAIGGDGGNMAFRRDAFLSADGYASSLDRLYGADDLLVSALAPYGSVRVCVTPPAIVREYAPDVRRAWHKRRLMRAASFARFPRSGNTARVFASLADAGVLAAALSLILAVVTAVFARTWMVGAAAALLAVALSVADIRAHSLLCRRTAERPFYLSLIFYRLNRPLVAPLWRLMAYAHRRDFIRKI